MRGSRSITTDDQGRFSFTALPAGRYTLGVNKPGHVSITYGQRRPGTSGTPIQLSDGQKFAADLQIPRGSVLTGTVLDENGEGTPGTNVRAMRIVNQGGRRTLQSSGSGTTDDRGIYRIHSLQPGDYVVCASPRNTPMAEMAMRGQEEIDAIRAELQAVQAAQAREEVARALQERLSTAQANLAQQPQEAPPGYAQICYPGTMVITEAAPLQLGVSEERPGIDFQLQLVPMARVSGAIVNGTGAQLQNVQITLQDAAAQVGGGFAMSQSARADAEGRFRFTAIPPGQYKLTARAQVGGPPARGGGPGRGEMTFTVQGGRAGGPGSAPPRPEPVTLWGATDVVVSGAAVENVMLSLQHGMSISGQMSFEGGIPPPADLTRMRVSLNSADPGPGSSSYQARVDASGRFTATSVPPGRYRVSASGAPGWFLESASAGGQDALDFPFEVKPNQASSIALTFTDKQTELTGTVVNDQNQPAVEYTLVIFPADSRYWVGPSRRIQTTRPATDGRFTVRNLPPGELQARDGPRPGTRRGNGPGVPATDRRLDDAADAAAGREEAAGHSFIFEVTAVACHVRRATCLLAKAVLTRRCWRSGGRGAAGAGFGGVWRSSRRTSSAADIQAAAARRMLHAVWFARKRLAVSGLELRRLALEAVARGECRIPCLEGFESRRRHALFLDQFGGTLRIDRTPVALRLAWREPLHEGLIVQRLPHAVDPAKTQRLVQRFLVGDAAFARGFLVHAQPELGMRSVVFREPGAEVTRGFEKHRVCGCDRRHLAILTGCSHTITAPTCEVRDVARRVYVPLAIVPRW